MPVAVYLRVSTEEQRERQSIQTQRDFAQRYVLRDFALRSPQRSKDKRYDTALHRECGGSSLYSLD